MKIWIVKRHGKNWWGNFPLEITMGIGDDKFRAEYFFYRKKDAMKYLKNNFRENSNYWMVTSAEVKDTKEDNRKK